MATTCTASAGASGSHPLVLSGLTTREQIADVVIRACLALDANDRALWESAWDLTAPDELVLDVNGNASKGLAALNTDILEHVGPMDTQHLITNLRIDVQEGASTGRVAAQALNQHFLPGHGNVLGSEHLLAGCAYDMELVKDASSQWKLRSWKLKLRWTQGTWAVMQPRPHK